MEKRTTISTSDDHIIDVWTNSQKENNNTVIIFVHGLTGSPHEHHYIQAPKYFNTKGFDTIRFSQYATGEKRRIPSETSIPIHASDLDAVIEDAKKRYSEIYLIGHSLGAPVILSSDISSIKKIVLWDPTIGLKSLDDLKKKFCTLDERIGKYIRISSGKEVLIGQDMVDSWVDASNLEKYIKRITKPCKFIFAEKEVQKDGWRSHLGSITAEWADVEVKGATHVFYEEGALEQVYDETLKWIEE